MYRKLLVPLDGSPPSQRGLDEALSLAREGGGSLLLVHVVDELALTMSIDNFSGFTADLLTLLREAGQKLLAEAAARCAAAGVPCETRLLDGFKGRVCDLVVEAAREGGADLIVMGTHGRRGAGRLVLGSDAEQVLRMATVPVLMVRAPQ